MGLPCYPAYACLDTYPNKTIIWKQHKCPPTEEWIKKMWYIYTMEYYTAIKKIEIVLFAATWMDLEIAILGVVSQTEKDRCYVSIICGIWITTQVELSKKQKQTRRFREQTCVCQVGGGGGGMNWELGISRSKLLHVEWMNNKVLLGSIGNYIQYPVINHNKKEYLSIYL